MLKVMVITEESTEICAFENSSKEVVLDWVRYVLPYAYPDRPYMVERVDNLAELHAALAFANCR